MTVRLLVLPVVTTKGWRGPKYIKSRGKPDDFDVTWQWIDFGLVDWALVAADLTPAMISAAANQSDVLLVPEDLDGVLSTNNALNVAAQLDAINFPSGWVSAGQTWRQVTKVIAGGFLYFQGVTSLAGANPFARGFALSRTYGSLEANWQNAMTQTAIDQKLLNSDQSLPPSWTIGQILEAAAYIWAANPLPIGELIEL